jgi:DNA-binding protein H-NS
LIWDNTGNLLVDFRLPDYDMRARAREDVVLLAVTYRRFKSAAKELSIQQLEDIKSKLQTIINERIAKEEAGKQESAERIEKIRKYKEMLAADGIKLEELARELSPGDQSKRAPRRPKYEVWYEAGNRITWTGQGWMPRIFREKIEAGEPLDTFLVDK